MRDLLGTARPVAEDLAELTTSLRDTGGLERLLDAVFFQVGAINGYDSLGHYLRAGLVVNTCTAYTTEDQPGCRSIWRSPDSEAATAAAANPANVKRKFAARAAAVSAGEDRSAEALGLTPAQAQQGEQASAPEQQDERAPGTLKMPSAMLPGQGAAPSKTTQAQRTTANPAGRGGTSSAQEGLLDYLLGGEDE